MKAIKILGVLLLLILLLIGGAALYVTQLFDPNDYKPQLVELAREHTGRELSIDGDLALTLFPWLGVTVGSASLANPEGFDGNFAQVGSADVRVKLMPLLSRQVEVGQIELRGLQVHLARDAEGTSNWDDLIAPGDTAPAAGAADSAPASETGPVIAGFSVGGLHIEDAALSWDDRASGQSASLRKLNVSTGALTPGSPVDLEASFEVESGAPAVSGQVALKGVVNADASGERIALADTRVNADLAGAGLPVQALKAVLAFAADLDLAKQRYALNGVTLDLGLSGVGAAGKDLEANASLDAVADLGAQTAEVAKLVVKAVGLDLSGTLSAQGLGSEPSIQGKLALAEFNPRDVLAELGVEAPPTADAEVLKVAALSTGIFGSGGSLELRDLAVKLDDTTLAGSASVQDLAAPAIGFDLEVDRIDLDRYLPPPPASDAEPRPGAPQTGGGEAGGQGAPSGEGLPVDLLRSLKLKGKVRIGELKVSGLRAADAQLEVNADGGLLSLEPFVLKLYQGSSQGAANLDVRGEQPRFAANNRLDEVQVEPLLQDLLGEAMIRGTGTVVADVRGVGLEPDAIKRTLNGKVNLQFRNGAVVGINVAQVIRQAKAKLSGDPAPPDAPNETDFAELTGTADINDGVVSNKDLAMKSPLLRVTGEGTVSLPAEQLDYLIKASIVDTSKGQGGKELEELRGVTIPVRVTGSFAEPKISPDLQAVLEDRAKQELQKRLDKEKGQVQEKLEQQLGDKLKGLIR